MRIFFTILSLFVTSLFIAQTVDAEDRDDSFISESNKNLLKIDVKVPFYQLPIKNCTNLTPASFEGGATAYKSILTKYMYTYLNSDIYSLNGDFSFTLTIDENGKVIDVQGAPKIQFSEVFFDDMRYVVRRIKKNWTPAKCDDKPVLSYIKLKMNFSSVTADL